MKKIFLITSSFILLSTLLAAQSVGINNNTPHTSSILDVQSSTKGMLIPRTSSASRIAIVNPAKGLMIYDTTSSSFWFHNGTAWAQLSASNNTWNLTGNAAINPGSNFIGTSDNLPLRFRVNNNWAGEINPVSGNVYLGLNAGQQTFANYSNVAIGIAALNLNTNKSNLIAIGDSALYNNGTGLQGQGFGVQNLAIGSKAMYANSTGSYNAAVGFEALYANNGFYNTAMGLQALKSNTDGIHNTAFGSRSLSNNTIGTDNTGIGVSSLVDNTTGYSNTAIGSLSLSNNTTASSNTAIGKNALVVQSYSNGGAPWASNNVAIGLEALYSNQPTSTSNGVSNTAVGTAAMRANTIGFDNTAVGTAALYSNTTGNENTAIGRQALFYNSTGFSNTATGYKALRETTNGSFNTADGHKAMNANTTGYSNTATGYNSMLSNTTGFRNTASGSIALFSNTTGSFNTAMGRNALGNSITGNNNTAVGNDALSNLTGGYQNIAIGWGSGTHAAAPNIYNTISIGNDGYLNGFQNQAFIGNTSTAWIGGQVNWSTYSDSRIKNTITEDVKGLDFIIRLRPVSYYKSMAAITKLTGNKETAEFAGKYEAEKIKYSGFLAQEVEAAAKQSNYNFSGLHKPKGELDLYSLSYAEFVVPLVKAVQEQQDIITNQQKQIDRLEKRLAALEAK